jgi:hypothetical protein
VGLDLVDRRGEVVVVDQVDQPVEMEVGHPDGRDQPLLVQVLHGPPGAVVVPEGLVDQVQVEVVEAEPGQRLGEGSLGAVLAAVLDPQLGGDEQLVPRDAAGGDGPADGLLVVVGLGGVEVAVADREGVADRLLGLVGRDLEDPEPQDRHLHAIVEGHEAHPTPSVVLLEQAWRNPRVVGRLLLRSSGKGKETPDRGGVGVPVDPGTARASLTGKGRI